MDEKCRTVRVMLESMAPVRSVPLIKSFELPHDEELVLIEREARGKSVQQIAIEQNLSIETVKRRRKSALSKIANCIS